VLTTVALEPATRDRLFAIKRKQGLRNMDAVLRWLLDPPLTAQQLFDRHGAAVRAVCRRHGVTRLVAIGSRARGDARPDSDLDLVASLPPGKGLFDIGRLLVELGDAFGVRVDLSTDGPHLAGLREALKRDGVVLIG
jgi:predicted nucleotidyltransferase